ncbi:MAG: SUMF1/EgtB/PvdO family nonheme iron enzyme, partial [Thermodesulfobacteriota bacterium]|nr:SUMF1/EgtB/PvdO family nonheme iron enzyme [Thermodesulfobacteriota bacterium]
FEEYLDVTKRFYNRHIWIPGGHYLVGIKNPTLEEQDERKVPTESFYIGEYPVINAIFKIFVEKTGYKTSAEKAGYGEVFEGKTKCIIDKQTGRKSLIFNRGIVCKIVDGACWQHPSGPESSIENKDNHPVVQVSIEDARAFAAWTGKRLPSEVEWEIAAKGNNGRIFPWGNEWEKDYCNYEDSLNADTTSVDLYQDLSRSPFGICDLLGNVLEWTSTLYEQTTKNSPPKEKHYIIKGGSFIDRTIFSTSRRLKASEKKWSNIIGFRCAV